jgi:hypothetical protein
MYTSSRLISSSEQETFRHRDHVLRDYITKRTWSINNEFRLIQWFMLQDYEAAPRTWNRLRTREAMELFHRQYPLLVEYEWEVEESRTDRGRGDLVFTDAQGHFAVVEVKMIQGETLSGRTACTRRTHARGKLADQALHYRTEYATLCIRSGFAFASVRAFGLSDEGFFDYGEVNLQPPATSPDGVDGEDRDISPIHYWT